MSIKPEHIVVQQDVEENYIVYDREISENPNPKFNNNILVTNDNLSNRLYFNMWYTFDDRELRNKEIKIVWVTPDGERGMTACEDKKLDAEGHRLSFSWNVPDTCTRKEGTIQFAVRITTENYIWNSLIGTVEVRKGLVTDEYDDLEEAQSEPGWLEYIEGKYRVSIQTLTAQQYANLTTKSDDVLYVVTLPNNNNITIYLGDKQISLS